MIICVYDAYDNYHRYELKTADIDYEDLHNFTAGTKVDSNGVQWNAQIHPYGLYMQTGLNSGYDSLAYMTHTLMESLGLPSFRNYGRADLVTALQDKVTHDFYFSGWDHSQGGSPLPENYFIYKWIKNTPTGVYTKDNVYQFLAQPYNTGFGRGYYDRTDGVYQTPSAGFLVIPYEDTYLIGYYNIVITKDNSGARAEIDIFWDVHNTFEAMAITETLPDPGEEGFHPIQDLVDKILDTIGGGDATGKKPGYKTDTIPLPGAPDESVASLVGAGFLNCYKVSAADLSNFGKCLYSSTLLTALANLFINPLDAVISLNVFPCAPSTSGSEAIKILNHHCTVGDLGVAASGSPLNKQFKVFDFGSISIPEQWESFLDYSATSATLYLPFIGVVDLDIAEIMGGSITVQYTVDFFTGACVANILCSRGITLADGNIAHNTVVHSFQGNCAINMPLTAVNYGNILGSFINAASTGLNAGLTGGVGALATNALSGGFIPTVTTKGSISANAGYCSVLYPYVTITRPIPIENYNYQKVNGYPSYIKGTLSEYQGLCVCDDIILTGVTGATESELNKIRQMCKDGVYV